MPLEIRERVEEKEIKEDVVIQAKSLKETKGENSTGLPKY